MSSFYFPIYFKCSPLPEVVGIVVKRLGGPPTKEGVFLLLFFRLFYIDITLFTVLVGLTLIYLGTDVAQPILINLKLILFKFENLCIKMNLKKNIKSID